MRSRKRYHRIIGLFLTLPRNPLRLALAPGRAIELRSSGTSTAISLGNLLRTMKENAVAPSTPLPACHY